MSNARDVALWALNLGTSCPPLSDVTAALQLLTPADEHTSIHPTPGPTVILGVEGCVVADVPGAPPCLAHLTGPFVSPHWQSIGYAIGEVRDAFPPGSIEHRFLAKNIERANAEYISALGFIGVCFPLGANGELDMSGNGIQGSLALPDRASNNGPGFATVAQTQAFYGNYPEPVTGASFQHV
jgi:hypothetical protein